MNIKISVKVYIGENAGPDFKYRIHYLVPNRFSADSQSPCLDFSWHGGCTLAPSSIYEVRDLSLTKRSALNTKNIGLFIGKNEFVKRVISNQVFLCFSGVWTSKCITWSDDGLGDWLNELAFEPGNRRL